MSKRVVVHTHVRFVNIDASRLHNSLICQMTSAYLQLACFTAQFLLKSGSWRGMAWLGNGRSLALLWLMGVG